MAKTTATCPLLNPFSTHVDTASLLRIAYYDEGPQDVQTVILVHGFLHDINSFAEAPPQLIQKGYRVIVPYLRGYGSTQFLKASTPRSREHTSLGYDLLALMDTLHIKQAILVGFDWGTIPVNVVAALWPERCDGMVAVGSYLIQDRRTAWIPTDPDSEAARWYFYLFLTPKGYAALKTRLRAYSRAIWARNSPRWNFSEAEVDHDPAYADFADAIDEQPVISVPSVTLDPEFSTTSPATNGSATAKYFTGTRVHHVVQGVGENIPQQILAAFVDAILQVDDLSKARSPARAI